MEASSILQTMLSASSIKGMSKTTGASQEQVAAILSQAMPVLLNGATKQTKGAAAKGFSQALADHAQNSTSNIGSFLKNVDLDDGAKIISHLLGSSTDSKTKSIAKAAGVDVGTTSSVLSAIGPLLMSLLGQSAGGNTSGSALGSIIGGLAQNVNVGDLLGGLLGGTSASTSSKSKTKKSSGSKGSIAESILGMLK